MVRSAAVSGAGASVGTCWPDADATISKITKPQTIRPVMVSVGSARRQKFQDLSLGLVEKSAQPHEVTMHFVSTVVMR